MLSSYSEIKISYQKFRIVILDSFIDKHLTIILKKKLSYFHINFEFLNIKNIKH